MRGETKRQNGTRGFYNGKSYGTYNINGNKKSSASFMFFNFPDSWGIGLKKGDNNGDDVGDMGMKEPGNEDHKTETNKGVEDDVRTIEVMDCEIDNETLCRGIIGEVKKLEYLDKLPGLCEIEWLYNVAVKHLGSLEVMIIVDSVETVNNVLGDIEHGIRRWMWKMRKWDDQYRPSGRLTWLNIMGVPIACWNKSTFKKIAALHGSIIDTNNCCLEGHQSVAIGRVMIHTITLELIKEVVHIKVKKRTYKVVVVEEISNVVEIEETQKATEEDKEEHQPENGENNAAAMDQEAYTVGEGDGEEDDEHQQAGNESQKSNLEDREARCERRSTEFEFELKVDNDVTLNEGSLAAKVRSNVSKTHGEENEEGIAFEKSGIKKDDYGRSRDNIEIIEEAKMRKSVDQSAHEAHIEKGHMGEVSNNKSNKIASQDTVIQEEENSVERAHEEKTDGYYPNGKKQGWVDTDAQTNNNGVEINTKQMGTQDVNVISQGNDIDNDRFNKKHKVSVGGTYEQCLFDPGRVTAKTQAGGMEKVRRQKVRN
ncbi:hypothetical protein CTI12_AA463020 [Artemisia annua]|uniref:Uncharacterized protein n=1 Tax=Artemisia annua TaxID=35608 RepID=A0A2U1LRH2_ARTAN|nr:hypothetical protein CTI12_AA463020 [Artemisia annua]